MRDRLPTLERLKTECLVTSYDPTQRLVPRHSGFDRLSVSRMQLGQEGVFDQDDNARPA
jgi:hypothetical protein